MGPQATDLATTVVYSTDRYVMNRVPWGLWCCAAGLAVATHADGGGTGAAAQALVYVPLLGLAFAGWAATTKTEQSGLPAYVVVPAGLLVYLLVVVVIDLFGTTGRSYGIGTARWSSLLDPPLPVFGWMLIYLGLGWIAYAVGRHVRPGRPVVSLSPSGVGYHRPWLRDVLIPWRHVEAVGHLDMSQPGQPASKNPNAIVAVVTEDFYRRVVAPKRNLLSPPGSNAMFRPRGSMVQMVLSSPEIAVRPAHLLSPLEARWRAFRDRPAPTTPQVGGQPGTAVVYGRWSFDRSWWQVLRFGMPLVAMVAVALHAIGSGPR